MKKLLSTFLIVAMVLCFMPTMAFAAVTAEDPIDISASYEVEVNGLSTSITDVPVKIGQETPVKYSVANGKLTPAEGADVKSKLTSYVTESNTGTEKLTGTTGKTDKNGNVTIVFPEGTVYKAGSTYCTLKTAATVKFKIANSSAWNVNINNEKDLAKYLALGIEKLANASDKTITVTFAAPSGGGGGAVTPPATDEGKTETTTKPDGSTVTTTTTTDKTTGVETVTEVTKDTTGQVTAEAEVSVPAQAAVTAGKAEATVSAAAEAKAVEQAQKAQEEAKKQGATVVDTTIVVEIAGAATADGITVKLSGDFADKAEAAGAALEITSGAADMNFDATAVKALAQGTGTVELTVEKDAKAADEVSDFVKPGENEKAEVLNLSAKVGTTAITSFGGGIATVKVKDPGFTAPQALYIAPSGNAYARATKVVTEGTAKYVQFETKRFSTYVIVEKAVADKALEATKTAKLKAGVKATTIKASSSAKKGAITIKWKKSAGYKVDAYQVFRSTKKNSGYGTKAFYTTKNGTQTTYKNSKQLKKGTRYYYKVRGVRTIDGEKVFTKWSNKAIRTAK